MKRLSIWSVALAICIGVFCLFPLFHIVRLDKSKSTTANGPVEAANRFWEHDLAKALSNAVPAQVLLPAIRSNTSAARRNYSRSLGLSDSYTYLLSGTGRIVSISDDEIALAITDGTTNTEVTLQTGLIFGNAVRDGLGVFSVNAFPNSQDFNQLSETLNHLVETRVLPGLKNISTGQRVCFAGCAEVTDESSDLQPLKVVPLLANPE